MQQNASKIYVVEDNPLTMRAYHDALVEHGVTVETFFNADDAFRALISTPEKPTLIISDIMMPQTNGLQFLERVRLAPETKGIPFVIVTTLEQQEYEEKARALGVSAYLRKDHLSMKELVEKVTALLA